MKNADGFSTAVTAIIRRLPPLAIAALLLSVPAGAANVVKHSSGRYLQDGTGKPLFLVGYHNWASVADGYYIDHPSRYSVIMTQGQPYKINYIRVSLGINRLTSSTDPASWNGLPTPIPFLYVGGKADLDQWDPVFWDGLKAQCALAQQKGVYIHLAIFDGVDIRGGSASYRYANSFWKPSNQSRTFYSDPDLNGNGNIDEGSEFYQLMAFNNNTGIGYYQRRLIDKVIAETAAYDNVFYEIGNELLSSPSDWNTAVINFVKARTVKAITQNGGSLSTNRDGWAQHAANTPAEVKSNVASIVGQGYPAWEDSDGPALIDGSADDLRKSAWYSFTGGAGCWGGFTTDFWSGGSGFNTTKATYYKNLMDFIDVSGVRFWEMTPQHSLVSNSSVNSCLAKTGSYYAAYILSDSSATINLSAVSGTAVYRLYDPKTGVWSSQQTVAGGGTRSFSKPSGAADWAILVGVTFSLPEQTPYGETPAAVPGVIQAENYDVGGQNVAYFDSSAGNEGTQFRTDDVDIEPCADAGSGYNVGWTESGEWLEYTVNVGSSGNYDLKMRVASGGAGGTFRIRMNGQDVSGPRVFGGTGGWQTWATVTVPSVALTAGQHILRVDVDAGGWNFNYLEISESTGTAEWNTLGQIQTLGSGSTPGIATDSQGNIHVVYMSGGSIYYRKANSAGVFGATETIPAPEGSASYNSPHVVTDVNGVPHVVFERDWAGSSQKAWYTNRIGGVWKTPILALYNADDRINYPRLALYGSYAFVTGFGASPPGVGNYGTIARLSNLSGTPTINMTIYSPLWAPYPVIDSTGRLFLIGRNSASGHYMQEYDLNLNPVGNFTKVNSGTYGKTTECTAAGVDSGNVVHIVSFGVGNAEEDDAMWYNNTTRISLGQGVTTGLLIPGQGWWGEECYPHMAVDAAGRPFIAYRHPATGQGVMTMFYNNAFQTPVVFGDSIPVRLRWNNQVAPASNGGVYVVWDSSGTVYFRAVGVGSGAPDTTPPAPVSSFTATAGNQKVTLAWTNSADNDVAGTMIRFKTNGYPTAPTDGTLVVDKSGAPGANDTYIHTGLTAGVTYYYSAFARDGRPNYSTPVDRSAVPVYVALTTISTSSFSSSADGWAISVWHSGEFLDGLMAWNSAAGRTGGGMRCNGSGSTDDEQRGTREGGEIRKTISTIGFDNIEVSYDLRVNNLGNSVTGTGTGSYDVDHNLVDEQLTVFYSTNGGSSWNEAEYITRATLLDYQSYGTRTLDLAGMSGVANSAGFTLRFRWQVNTASDTVDLDNIVVRGSVSGPPDTTPPGPVTGISAVGGAGQVSLSWTNPGDSDFAGTMLRYKTTGYPTNSTDGTLATSQAGSPGAADGYTHSGLGDGVTYYYSAFAYDGHVNYSNKADASATTLVGVCFDETFPYPNGSLNGRNGWVAPLTNEISVVGQTVRIIGGAGAREASRTLSCSGTGGLISVKFQAMAGYGSATMWSLYIDDSSGQNLARWYGSGTTARGRIAGTGDVTAVQNLSGAGVWDDLEARINTTTDTSEFLFKGVSIGVLSHASQAAGNLVGRIRIERIDNNDAAGQSVYLDNIVLGSDTTAPGPVTNFTAVGGNAHITLTWDKPSDSDLAGVKIQFKTIGLPTGPTDGITVYSGTGTSYTHTGRTNGMRYYYSAFAFDSVPNYSAKADAAAHAATDAGILETKGLADSQVRALRGNVVSAVGSGYFYLQATDVLQGVKAVTNEVVAAGQELDVIGVMGGSGVERWIDVSGNKVVVTNPGPVSLDAVGMGASSVGGSLLNALAPGVAGGTGPNNIGLLVTVWGKVTQRDRNLGFFYIDDGSGLKDGTNTEVSPGVFEESVGVRILANPTNYAENSYVAVTGVVSTFNSGGLRPQILPAAGGVILIVP